MSFSTCRSNYIKIDVFYKELSYKIVKQQKAFGFLSFLSEIGGFLGLLMGASVLTVCELIDYIAGRILRKLKGRRRIDKRQKIRSKTAPTVTSKIEQSFHGLVQ